METNKKKKKRSSLLKTNKKPKHKSVNLKIKFEGTPINAEHKTKKNLDTPLPRCEGVKFDVHKIKKLLKVINFDKNCEQLINNIKTDSVNFYSDTK